MTNGYLLGQLARALVTANEHEDAAARSRADARVRSWVSVLEGVAAGRIAVGSRTPVQGLPAWVTLDVMHGGFATGAASAAGPLEADELERIQRLGLPRSREAIFASYLTDAGFAELSTLLRTRAYDVRLPEDGALLTVAALTRQGQRVAALELLDTLRPYAGSLRFMPRAGVPSSQPADHVSRRTAADVQASLARVAPNRRIETQREALSVWLPLTDRFREFWHGRAAVETAWGADDLAQAEALLADYEAALRDHPRCRKYRNPKENLPILVAATRAASKGEFDARWGRRVQHVLGCIEAKHGGPGGLASDRLADVRRAQAAVAEQPAHHRLAAIAAHRLESVRPDEGVQDVAPFLQPVTGAEAAATDVPERTAMPGSVVRKVGLGLSAPIERLISQGLVPSAEVLAELVPALTSRQVASSVADAELGALLGDVYAAFRRRRTLLLLNLEKQVQFTELPWVRMAFDVAGAPVDGGAVQPDDPATVARQVAALAIDSFPGTILPNPLISELSTLYAAAGIDVPLTEELAVDIFMGRFSPKFTRAAKVAAQWLRGSLYEAYYGISYVEVLALPEQQPQPSRLPGWVSRGTPRPVLTLAVLCARAVPNEDWSVAANGRIVERQQILTTHNLAALLDVGRVQPRRPMAELAEDAAARAAALLALAQRQDRPLATVKDAAYAWRQAVFFLSLTPRAEWPARVEKLRLPPLADRWPMSEIIDGLAVVASGGEPRTGPFLGWTLGPHWVLSRRAGGRR